MTFKKNLRTELDYLDLTVKELSAKTGIAKGTLDCYLGLRESMPPADIAVKIAKELGVSVEYLVTGKDEKSIHSYNPTIRSIIQIVLELNEKDNETILGLAKLLKKQADKI
ncbi:helix-turn-helix domain-containing protein [Treponema primitia]|uniref:helix-turn-helix domain-containing protein n=1 Tax=Treponema primitia TaxID=88058 RepID=UPI001E563B97|nr:helix-turn-helix domain-containing protein [Treponema primitia]